MSPKILTERPQEGQFIEIWRFQDKIWSNVFRWVGEELLMYDDETQDLVDCGDKSLTPSCHNLSWIVYE